MTLSEPIRWGRWYLNHGDYELERRTPEGVAFDSISLFTCTQSSQILDWILHMSNGGRIESNSIDLVKAFNDLLHPRATMCSHGADIAITADDVKLLVDAYVEERHDGVFDVVRKIQARPLVRALSPLAWFRACMRNRFYEWTLMNESAQQGRLRGDVR